MLRKFLSTDNDPAALVMRLALGLVFFAHGGQKVLGWWGGYGASATIQGFAKMGLPPVVTVLIMAAELGGGILLILGFLTRLAALGIGCVMAGALFLVHAKVGFFMNWAGTQKGEGFEYHILALGLAIALLIKGGGALSVDRALAREDREMVAMPATPRM
ncbi:MAG TPA: DoxX family protein [Myxococcales bacterium]|jgi:putative oxidoreductase|nr:DoxX family protein [Myxococcales bacterium]